MAETIFGVLSGYDSVVEVGVGRRPELAGRLAEAGVSVVATDVVERELPSGVEFVLDDVTDPERAVYEGADAIYAQRLPPELQRPLVDLATSIDAACYFTTLGGDPAVVPVTPLTVASGTVFVARD